MSPKCRYQDCCAFSGSPSRRAESACMAPTPSSTLPFPALCPTLIQPSGHVKTVRMLCVFPSCAFNSPSSLVHVSETTQNSALPSLFPGLIITDYLRHSVNLHLIVCCTGILKSFALWDLFLLAAYFFLVMNPILCFFTNGQSKHVSLFGQHVVSVPCSSLVYVLLYF